MRKWWRAIVMRPPFLRGREERAIVGLVVFWVFCLLFLAGGMAATPDPHSSAAEFFINVVDNPNLDFKSKANDKTWGYCVFGRVVKGMDVVDRIKAVKTSNKRSDFLNLPVKVVLIKEAVQIQ